MQDTHGFLWLGTELGQKKFDGYKFINYQHDPENPYRLSGSTRFTELMIMMKPVYSKKKSVQI